MAGSPGALDSHRERKEISALVEELESSQKRQQLVNTPESDVQNRDIMTPASVETTPRVQDYRLNRLKSAQVVVRRRQPQTAPKEIAPRLQITALMDETKRVQRSSHLLEDKCQLIDSNMANI